ncbi:hypothetical protein EX30DRAFT_394812 [Ascodesmis nigricans]|uniref:F-box domain-containing protein n=1 Tax=Ascodesmis nigricans TaxID=341454 RepID=A0A4S2N0C0_9PEZI|nr:hypothetical protein EX30DRAFT_394812 [Ascodesmis nigricans]
MAMTSKETCSQEPPVLPSRAPPQGPADRQVRSSRLDPFAIFGCDILLLIAELLPPIDIIRCQLVSRLWHEVLDSPAVSKACLLKSFPCSTSVRELLKSHHWTTSAERTKNPVFQSDAFPHSQKYPVF